MSRNIVCLNKEIKVINGDKMEYQLLIDSVILSKFAYYYQIGFYYVIFV